METVKAELERKRLVREEEERQMAMRAEEKAKRRAAKEAKKRAEERAALQADVDEQFIKKGQSVENIGAQDILEIDGNGNAKPIVGALGGILG